MSSGPDSKVDEGLTKDFIEPVQESPKHELPIFHESEEGPAKTKLFTDPQGGGTHTSKLGFTFGPKTSAYAATAELVPWESYEQFFTTVRARFKGIMPEFDRMIEKTLALPPPLFDRYGPEAPEGSGSQARKLKPTDMHKRCRWYAGKLATAMRTPKNFRKEEANNFHMTTCDYSTPQVFKREGRSSLLITRELGIGGMGVVILGHDFEKIEDPWSAIKLSLVTNSTYGQNPMVLLHEQRFRQEMKLLELFTKEGIVHPFRSSRSESTDNEHPMYLEMEYKVGSTLGDLLGKAIMEDKVLRHDDAVDLFLCVARIVEINLSKKIVHRDIKAGNFFITDKRVLAMDYGVASNPADPQNDVRLTQTNASVGTPTHIAPEAWHNATTANEATEMYSIAVMFASLLAGVDHDTIAKFQKETPHVVEALMELVPKSRLRPALAKMLIQMGDPEFAKRGKLSEHMQEIYKLSGFSEKETTSTLEKFRATHYSSLQLANNPRFVSRTGAPLTKKKKRGVMYGIIATGLVLAGFGLAKYLEKENLRGDPPVQVSKRLDPNDPVQKKELMSRYRYPPAAELEDGSELKVYRIDLENIRGSRGNYTGFRIAGKDRHMFNYNSPDAVSFCLIDHKKKANGDTGLIVPYNEKEAKVLQRMAPSLPDGPGTMVHFDFGDSVVCCFKEHNLYVRISLVTQPAVVTSTHTLPEEFKALRKHDQLVRYTQVPAGWGSLDLESGDNLGRIKGTDQQCDLAEQIIKEVINQVQPEKK